MRVTATRVADNHHHLVCRSCGRVEDVDCAVGHAPCLEPAERLGYVVSRAEVTFWGLCEKCQPESRPQRPADVIAVAAHRAR